MTVIDLVPIEKHYLSDNTNKAYQKTMARFTTWLLAEHPNMVKSDFASILEDYTTVKSREAAAREFLEGASPQYTPLELNTLSSQACKEWLSTLKKSNGGVIGNSTIHSHRAAITDQFRRGKTSPGHEFSLDLTQFVRSLKRTNQLAMKNDMGEIKTGKDPLQFSRYVALGKSLQSSTATSSMFSHLFTVLSWNLMCRSATTCAIRTSHMDWSDDSLLVYIGQQKNDQFGTKPRDPKHIYANPLLPAICPILSLALYLACSPPDGTLLFPGKLQNDRFAKLLQKQMNDMVESHNIGTHSLRKGSATFASSGTTDAPSQAAICLRAGWTMGVVGDTYFRFERAGDQFVGRVASGLPPNAEEFALLPPLLPEEWPYKDILDHIVKEFFSAFVDTLPYGLLNALSASIVYHHEYLWEVLPKNHAMYTFPSFGHGEFMANAKSIVVSGYEDPSSVIRATGIPSHVSMKREMTKMKEEFNAKLDSLRPQIDSVGDKLIDSWEDHKEDCALQAGVVTPNKMQKMIDCALANSILSQQVDSIEARLQQQESSIVDVQEDPTEEAVWLLRYKLPEDYRLTAASACKAFVLWHIGLPPMHIPPLKRLTAGSFSHPEDRKRFPDLKCLCVNLQRLGSEAGISRINIQSQEDAIGYFERLIEAVPILDNTSKMRRKQMSWRTACNRIRKYMKNQKSNKNE